MRDVTVRFAGLTALDAVSFTVEPGSVHAVIGPNGAGKSTTFNVLSGVYRATSGTVHLGDTELTGLAPHRIADLGVARTFQNLALPPHATVAESLMLGRHRLTRAGFVASGLRLPPRPGRPGVISNGSGRSRSSSAWPRNSTSPRAPSRTASRSSSSSAAPCAWSPRSCSWTSPSRA